jgi:hypothetical protein
MGIWMFGCLDDEGKTPISGNFNDKSALKGSYMDWPSFSN